MGKHRVLTKLPIFDKKWFFEEIREFWGKGKFLTKFQNLDKIYLTKFLVFDKRFNFWPNFRFLIKNHFLTKLPVFDKNCVWTKFPYFDKKFDFWPNCRYLTKNRFWPNSRFLSKKIVFDQIAGFWQKVRFSNKLPIFRYKICYLFFIFDTLSKNYGFYKLLFFRFWTKTTRRRRSQRKRLTWVRLG